jgi:hypothetical protein
MPFFGVADNTNRDTNRDPGKNDPGSSRVSLQQPFMPQTTR